VARIGLRRHLKSVGEGPSRERRAHDTALMRMAAILMPL
jgi:hypothetical protein